jgi:hypothetical protein
MLATVKAAQPILSKVTRYAHGAKLEGRERFAALAIRKGSIEFTIPGGAGTTFRFIRYTAIDGVRSWGIAEEGANGTDYYAVRRDYLKGAKKTDRTAAFELFEAMLKASGCNVSRIKITGRPK